MHKNHQSGFTLVEIMIVVVIVGLLAGIAMPAFKRVQMSSQNAKVANDIRVYSGMMDTYSQENGAYPEDSNSGELPVDFAPYIKISQWEEGPAIGGDWDIEKDSFGIVSAVGVHQYTVSDEQILTLDKKYDDGNLATGNYRKLAGDRYYYIVAE